jgi:hypothetical protein
MFEVTDGAPGTQAVDLLACEVLADLYEAYCGSRPLAVRAYRDEEAMLLLLRFEPGSIDAETQADPFVSAALGAMPGLIASAVEARIGRRLAAGNLSICSQRGLAVLAFSELDDEDGGPLEDDPFRIEAPAPALGCAC